MDYLLSIVENPLFIGALISIVSTIVWNVTQE